MVILETNPKKIEPTNTNSRLDVFFREKIGDTHGGPQKQLRPSGLLQVETLENRLPTTIVTWK